MRRIYLRVDEKLPEDYMHQSTYLGMDEEWSEHFAQGSDQQQIKPYEEDLLGTQTIRFNATGYLRVDEKLPEYFVHASEDLFAVDAEWP